MKLKELFEVVEAQNKMAKFMQRGYREVETIKIDDTAFKNDTFETAEELVETINNEYYANIDTDIELTNNNGYIQMTFIQNIPDFKYIDGTLTKEIKEEEYTINLYIDTEQVWD